jgi:GNAT superfamily N-acetyltransferase
MPVVYRRVRQEDLAQVARVYATAINNLDIKHGFAEGRMPPSLSANPQFSFWLENASRPFWVAREGSKVVGFTYSFLRGSFWFLADLFILPTYQGKGIGGNLIRKTLASWKGHKISNRALITPAFNRVSVSLYMRFGMLPRQPLYFAEAPREKIQSKSRSSERFDSELVDIPAVSPKLDRLHMAVLGFPSGWHNEFFHKMQGAKCLLFKKEGKLEGYAIFRRDGKIGPLLVKAPSSFRPAMESTLRTAARNCEKVSILFAGTNREAVEISIENGFSIKYPMLFLSSKSMGDWTNYLFFSPGLM